MWTPTALASNAVALDGTVWRVVEHQYTSATRRIVGSLAEHEVLEDILEESKPPYPAGTEHLDYLLKTPFRYLPVGTTGSRFRRPRDHRGVFYASEQLRTAMAEMAYYRIRFFRGSESTRLPRFEERLTAFSVAYQTLRGIDLLRPPLNRDRRLWTNPVDYSATQALSDNVREGGLVAIRYESVRDPANAANLALLSPAIFTVDEPLSRQSWLLYQTKDEVSVRRDGETGESFSFACAAIGAALPQ